MFKVKQLFTYNYLLLLYITLFLVYFNSFVVIRSQGLNSQKVIKIIKVGNIDLKSIIEIVIRYFLVIECKNSLVFSFIIECAFSLLFCQVNQ